MKPFCNDLKITVQEFQKEIDEHKITDTKTILANKAVEDAFGYLCTSMEKPDCESLNDASETWAEEIDRFTNKIPVIPLFGWIAGKGMNYYKRVQKGVDDAIKELKCKV